MNPKKTKNLIVNGEVLETGYYSLEFQKWLNLMWGAPANLSVLNNKIIAGTPVNAVAATGTLTISGVAKDGETVTIGTDVYEFAADTAQTVGVGRIPVDITAATVAAQGVLSMYATPTVGDTVTIGTTAYTFVAAPTGIAGDVSIGGSLANSKAAIVIAINGTDGVNSHHPLVSASEFGAGDDSTITARVGGTAGNSIATTETFTSASNYFNTATLGTTIAGVDCTAANAVTALALAITTNDTQGVSGVDGAGNTVVLTADILGTSGNSIATTKTMANASFAAAHLVNGVDGTIGDPLTMLIDATNLYITYQGNTIADANWTKLVLQAL